MNFIMVSTYKQSINLFLVVIIPHMLTMHTKALNTCLYSMHISLCVYLICEVYAYYCYIFHYFISMNMLFKIREEGIQG